MFDCEHQYRSYEEVFSNVSDGAWDTLGTDIPWEAAVGMLGPSLLALTDLLWTGWVRNAVAPNDPYLAGCHLARRMIGADL